MTGAAGVRSRMPGNWHVRFCRRAEGGNLLRQAIKLKLVKRQAYGRAGFALLRRRYLLAS